MVFAVTGINTVGSKNNLPILLVRINGGHTNAGVDI